MANGKVWLVGAGPGDGGLLTRKGMYVLERADVVVYDALVGAAVLELISPLAQKVYVGKRSSHHTMKQEEINRCLVHYAKQGKRVVRLKGGDPFLFGRGGEEAEALLSEHIPYEVVPGVPSAIAVPAYNGIPVTHRDYCSSLHIITGHKKAGKVLQIDFDALCRMGGTMVFLMGVSSLPYICRGLLASGMDPKTPAAVLSQGTTSEQTRLLATLSTLEDAAAKNPVKTPAIIVIGEVCSLAERFDWYGQLPLSGRKIFVTSPKGRGREMLEAFRELGAQALELPAICLKPYEENEMLSAALSHLEKFSWIVFTSPSAVTIFFDRLVKQRIDIRSLQGIRFAVTGKGTMKKLEQRGIFKAKMPTTASGEELGKLLCTCLEQGAGILIPRAKKGHPALMAELKKRQDLHVCEVPLYDTVLEENTVLDLERELSTKQPAIVVFTSPLTVEGFVKMTNKEQRNQVQAVCIGEATNRRAMEYEIQTEVSDAASAEAVVKKVMEIAAKEEG